MKQVFRILLLILASITFLSIAGLGLIWISWFDPFVELPDIVRDQSNSIVDAGRGFEERVAETFPPGMAESDLVQQLAARGFTVDSKYRVASFEKSHFPCSLYWEITWEAEQGLASQVKAWFRSYCL